MAGRTTGVNNERGTCTQHNQDTLSQRNSEVVNLTGLAENKGLDVWCKAMVPKKVLLTCSVENGCLFAVNEREQCFAVGCIISIKERTGVDNSLDVSLHNR